jgi:hypothetical protein
MERKGFTVLIGYARTSTLKHEAGLETQRRTSSLSGARR